MSLEQDQPSLGSGLPSDQPPEPTVDADSLLAAIHSLATTIDGHVEAPDVLRQLLASATTVLQVDGAGVMVPGPGGNLVVACTSPGPAEDLERAQQDLGQGPCHESHHHGRTINIGDLSVEGRWPEYEEAATALGVRTVAAVPLRARGRGWGVLDVYRSMPVRLSGPELSALGTLAQLATTCLLVAEDRSRALGAQHELAHRAMHDPLTGLTMRWVLLEQLQHALSRMARRPQNLAVLFMDLDGLKYVNDTLGHRAGDQLLVACTTRFQSALREGDTLARMGGDEFVVLLEDLTSPEEPVTVAKRILAAMLEPVVIDGHHVPPSVSIGIAVADTPTTTPEAVITHADAAMYRAKRAGPGRYQVFDAQAYADDLTRHEIREQLGRELRRAIREGELEVHYQPIFDHSEASRSAAGSPARDRVGALYAVESLVRWRHPERGLLTAEVFVDAAVHSGLIIEIGAWVLTTACRQIAAWDGILGAHAPPRLFFNISPAELAHPSLPRTVEHALADAGIAANRLTVEITETGLNSRRQATARNIDLLKELGTQLAVDDFGTGYSTLSRLVKLSASALKVDQAFTRELLLQPEANAVVTMIVLLGHNLRRVVVIEGVETAEILATLLDMGATHLQGFHLSPPLPADELGDAIAQGRLRTAE
jgi:diguanylate cyclase (GGDEF)-like protein